MLLFVCSKSEDVFLEYPDEVDDGGDDLVLLTDGRERPVGWVQVVRAR